MINLFSFEGCQNLDNPLMVIEAFCLMSGPKFSRVKCSIAGMHTQEGRVEELASVLGR